MLVLTSIIVLVLISSGARIVKGYDEYEDVSENDKEDYIHYDVVDDEEPGLASSFNNEIEEVKSNRIRRDQDYEGQVVNVKIRNEDEEQETINSISQDEVGFKSKATLGPEDFTEVKVAINKLLSGIAVDNNFTPLSTTSSFDFQPTMHSNITSTTPSYTAEQTSSVTEEPSTISNEEMTLTSLMRLASERDREDWPTRSSKIISEIIMNNFDNFTTLKALKEGDSFFRASSNATVKTGRTPQIDIAKLLAIISDLAKDFESNLTRRLNESIAKMSVPTCSTPTAPTTTLTTATDEYDANYTGAIIAKCFVCGLDVPGIPQHAHCADAFAGDFLPLLPVDTSAKGKISRFRKYCKYANIRGYRTKKSQPRVLIGRWTGGCSVRWVDLSGVYTQRACRNRLQPTMGLHFASKRMAKLEKALWNIEEGCIISPVATLTPLSRGVSLYARFHACVCSGNWCNAGVQLAPPWALLLAAVPRTC